MQPSPFAAQLLVSFLNTSAAIAKAQEGAYGAHCSPLTEL